MFRNRLQPRPALVCGVLVALSARYLSHILSGWILFSGWAEWFFTQEGFPLWGSTLVANLSGSALGLAYSVVYNGMYMIPELILTTLAAALVGKYSKILTKA